MSRKFNPWLLVMFIAPLLVLALPALIKSGSRVQMPGEALLWDVVQNGFYLAAVGVSLLLLARSAWGAEWEQIRRFVGTVCLFLSLPCALLIPTIVLAPLGAFGFLSLFLVGLILVGSRRK